MADQAPQEDAPVQAQALVEEIYGPNLFQVIAPDANEIPPGQEPMMVLQAFVGQLRPGVFMTAKTARVSARDALAFGEHIVTEARRALTGIVVPKTHAPRDLTK